MTRVNPANSIRHTQRAISITQYDMRYTSCEFFVQTNPICTNGEYALTCYAARAYGATANFSRAKAKPNKPKQSQSDPRFSLTRAPQIQNEPKQTQSVVKPGKPDQAEQPYPLSRQRYTRHGAVFCGIRGLAVDPRRQITYGGAFT